MEPGPPKLFWFPGVPVSGVKTIVGKKVVSEVMRYKKFTKSLLGGQSDVAVDDIDTKVYVKFLLKEGSLEEKREIMSCFRSKILLKNKRLSIKSTE